MANPDGSSSVAQQFLDAVSRGDHDGTRALCTTDGWDGSGDSARRYYKQVHGQLMNARQSGPAREHRDRAAVPVQLSSPDGAQTQDLWILLRHHAEWQIEGTAADWSLAGLYVHGDIERPPSFADLPETDIGSRWTDAWLAGEEVPVDDEDALATLEELRREASDVQVDRAVELPGSGRVAVRLSFSDGDDAQSLWAILGADDKGLLHLVGRSWSGSLGALVAGLDPAWPLDAAEAARRRYSESEARDILQQAIGEALSERGVQGQDDLGGRMAGILTELFTSALDEEAPPEEDLGDGVVDLEAERRRRTGATRTRTATEQRLQSELQQAIADFMTSKRIDSELTTDDLKIDSAFVKENGGEMFGRLFGAMMGAILPEDLSVEVPGSEAQEGAPVRMKLDVADLIQGLFEPRDDK